MYILIPVIFLFVLTIFPITICIHINAKLKDKKVELEAISGLKNDITLKLFKFLPVYKRKLFSQKRKHKKKSGGIKIANVAFKTLKIDSLYLSLGINTYSYILNSYLNAILNTTICLYINSNNEKFNFQKLYYQIYISDMPLVINLEANVSTSIIKIIYVYIKSKVNKNKKSNNKISNNNKNMNKCKISCTY